MNAAWYLSRSAGLVAYLLLFLAVALGLSVRGRSLDRVIARWRVTDLHVYLSVLALGFVVLHATALLWDNFVGYTAWQILLPFTAGARAFWTGVGVIAAYLLVIVVVSFAVRRWIGYRAWRTLHYSTFGLYVIATLHGIFTGTDTAAPWVQGLYIVTGGCVLALTLLRIVHVARRRSTGNIEAPLIPGLSAWTWSMTALGIAGVVLLAGSLGPFHWFAGETGGSGSEGSDIVLAPATQSAAPQVAFSDQFTGSITTNRQSATAATLVLHLDASGQQPATVEIGLTVDTTSNQITGTALRLSAPGGSALCSGQLTELDERGFNAVCQGTGALAGHTLALTAQFSQLTDTSAAGTLTSASR